MKKIIFEHNNHSMYCTHPGNVLGRNTVVSLFHMCLMTDMKGPTTPILTNYYSFKLQFYLSISVTINLSARLECW